MASVSSTSSLGNTSLRGFGGMTSGIDRDAIIEKMTLGTTTKINNQKSKVTQLQWKQEAYRGISDKILDWTDTYTSYASGKNLKDPTIFSKNQITLHGKEDSTRFVSVTGTSSMVDNVSIKGVAQTATSTVRQSDAYISEKGVVTSLDDLKKKFYTPKLEGTFLKLGTLDGNKEWSTQVTFNFASSYEENGQTKAINYAAQTKEELKGLVNDLNQLLAKSQATIGEEELGKVIEFKLDESSGKIEINSKQSDKIDSSAVRISGTALAGLGYEGSGDKISVDEFNNGVTQSLSVSATYQKSALETMTGAKLTFNYNGSQKSIELITEAEASALNGMTDESDKWKAIQDNLQKRLNQAFGTGAVTVGCGENGNGPLSFNTASGNATLSISGDYTMLQNLGLKNGASNKVNLNDTLKQDAIVEKNTTLKGRLDSKQGQDPLTLRINGVDIDGLAVNSRIGDILSKINSTSAAGVKATYVEATGKFALISSETGQGRTINLEGDLADLFTTGGSMQDGTNAKILVSYGNGMDVMLERSSNTFNLEGLNVTVSGTFGNVENKGTEAAPDWTSDTSQSVTFSAKADAEGALEKVKEFIKDYNALVTEVNNQIRTRPDSDYPPLTDEQKESMDKTSIENWEKKAKEGLLYGDSIMRDLSADIQGVFSRMLGNGANYEDMKAIGITYAEDWGDGGTLVLDEAKFKAAMESTPEKVSNIFTGGGSVKKGLVATIEETFIPYATKYAGKNGSGGKGSYGRLIEVAGSDKKPTTLTNNTIYKQLKEMNEAIEKLKDRLKVEQDRYISQFTTMESLMNKMNTQSGYLSQLTASA